jgi:hypothetical protein
LLPVVFGTLAVLVCALLTRRLLGSRTGLAAAFVMAIAPAHIHYAQYVRSYSLFTLLAGVHVLLLVRCLDHQRPKWLDLVSVTLVTAALLYTHYLCLLLFAAEGVYALYRLRELRMNVVRWGAAAALGGLLFLPGLPLLLHNVEYDRIRNAERPEPPPAWDVFPNIMGELSVGQRILGFDDRLTRRATLAAAAVVFPLLAIIGIVAVRREHREALLLLALVSFLPLLVYIGTGRRLIAVRFFVPFMFGYLAFIGAGLASLKRTPALVAGLALAAVCAVPLVHYYRDFRWSYDHRTVASALASRAQPGDAVIVVHPFEAFFYRWYLGHEIPIRGMVFTALEDQGGYVIKPPPVQFDRAIPRVLEAAERHTRLWVIGGSPRSFATDMQEEQRILSWLDARFDRVADLDYVTGGDPRIRLYDVRRVKGSM